MTNREEPEEMTEPKNDLQWNHKETRWEFWRNGELIEHMNATEAADWPYEAQRWLANLRGRQNECR